MTVSAAGQNDTPLVGPTPAPGLHVMSYNIRRTIRGTRHGSPDFWPARSAIMGRLLEAEAPTILGTQEVMPRQADAIGDMLGRQYRRIGHGRGADQRGEGCPLYYDAGRVSLTRWSQLALSPAPRTPGSRGWGNLVPRVAVAAEFIDLDTGATFGLLNTHFDHLSRRSRVRSAEMIVGLIERSEHPVIVMGDFNAQPRSASHRTLIDSGLRDTWEVATSRRGRSAGTYSGYSAPKPDGRRIDWMLVSPGIDVQVATINTARFEGRAPSDHEPIQAVLRIDG